MTDKEMADAIKEKIRELNELMKRAATENYMTVDINDLVYSGHFHHRCAIITAKISKVFQ